MPPHKSLSPKPLGPPKTPPELRSLKLSISFRADQMAARAAVAAVLRKCGGENESV
jgi:hypothetical protein